MKKLRVSSISAAEHLAFIQQQPSVSFLQTPAWGAVKQEWRSESIGWFAEDELVGAGLVLYRNLPKTNWSLAYLPEGPAIGWEQPSEFLPPMLTYLKQAGAFAVRIGPPVVVRTWDTTSIKAAIADPNCQKFSAVPASQQSETGAHVQAYLESQKWLKQGDGSGFAAGQPAFNFQLPLAGKQLPELLAGMNQLWRRNIKKAAKVGVEITQRATGLADFHQLYLETALRDGFTPRPLSYFENMQAQLTIEAPERFRLYFAHHEGDLVASTIMIQVGAHAWYSYGASSTAKRDVRGSNAIQWQMIQDAHAAGCAVYDLRGITETVAQDDPHVGLINFKVGTGGEAVEYVGEWDYPIRNWLYRAFLIYLRRRG